MGPGEQPLLGRFPQAVQRTVWGLWALLLVSLPITSFPPLGHVAGGTIVSPFSIIPLALLVAVWLIPALYMGTKLHGVTTPLLAFTFVAALASGLSVFYELRPYHGQRLPLTVIEGLGTLMIALAYYLVAARLPTSNRRINWSLRWIYVGGLGLLIWATIQIPVVLGLTSGLPTIFHDIHGLLSSREMSTSRVTGFAYEPSWLANQLVLLYIPIWLGQVLGRTSVFPPIFRKLRIELLLLIWAVPLLVLSFSRVGLLSLAAILLAAASIMAVATSRRLREAVDKRLRVGSWLRAFGSAIMILGFVGIIIGTLALLALSFSILATYDQRVARFFQADLSQFLRGEQTIYGLANSMALAERFVYWGGGLRVFSEYPILGVGLGNSGFLFEEVVPRFGYALPEIIRILGGASFPNPKSLWIRLLAETGIVGFISFLIWIGLMAVTSLRVALSRKANISAIGIAGLLCVAAQVFEGFSLDTFALPQLWVMLGLVTATATVAERNAQSPVTNV